MRPAASAPNCLAVVALVAEKPGFVAGAEIDFVAHAVFADFHRAHGVGRHAAGARDAFDAGEVRIHGHHHAPGVEAFVEQRQPLRQALPGGEVGDFHRQHVGELVGHHAGQEIRVAVDRAVAVGRRRRVGGSRGGIRRRGGWRVSKNDSSRSSSEWLTTRSGMRDFGFQRPQPKGVPSLPSTCTRCARAWHRARPRRSFWARSTGGTFGI